MKRAIVSFVFASSLPGVAIAADPLPQGDRGIAAAYPNDEGIGGDPGVIFVEDFESYTDPNELWNTWDNVFQMNLLTFTTDAENVWGGTQAIEMTLPMQDAELGNALAKILAPERDVLYLRYYSKFMGPFDVVGSSHNGSWISSHYEDENGQATPGIPADGMNKFLVAYENWRGEPETASPGFLNVYVYHPEQRDIWGDHFFPTGLVSPNTSLPFDFGPDFVPYPDVIPELDRWYCWEVMVQANTPGQLDGRIAFWLDGALAADFMNLRLRDVDTLTIDRFGVGFHIHSNPNGEQKKWYDNIVAAESYIGPMFVPGSGDSGADDTAGDDAAGDDAATEGDGGGTQGGGNSGPDATGQADDDDAGPGSDSASNATSGGQGSSDDASGCTCNGSGSQPVLPLLVLVGLALTRRRGSIARTTDDRRDPTSRV